MLKNLCLARSFALMFDKSECLLTLSWIIDAVGHDGQEVHPDCADLETPNNLKGISLNELLYVFAGHGAQVLMLKPVELRGDKVVRNFYADLAIDDFDNEDLVIGGINARGVGHAVYYDANARQLRDQPYIHPVGRDQFLSERLELINLNPQFIVRKHR